MKAFHGDPAIKAKYQARLAAHRADEHLTQGIGWESGKGCAVGCTLEAYNHAAYKTELGLPEWLARLEDRIFEGLPKGEAEQFSEDFLAAIPVGANVEPVKALLASQRHRRDLERLKSNTEPYAEQCRQALQKVIDWLEAGAAEVSRSAAESAAESAWWSAAAESAAESAAAAAESAAESAWSAAWSEHFRWEASTLLQLLKDCK